MNKQLKTIFAVALCAMMLLALVACGGGDSIVGTTWKLTSAESNGVILDADMIAMSLGEMVFKFEANGKVAVTLSGKAEEGTYTVNGDTVSIDDGYSTVDATISGNTMTYELNGAKMIFTKQ
ncbi:MAG: hypothetical protein E7328_02685 [Clostridiales bacterium]|nr:hypothetical protein [Clostridiales bacterium]